MNILLTNDDGFSSTGIQVVKKILIKYGHVVICAPAFQNSAKSTSKTLRDPIKVNKIEDDVYSISGTPADCVAFGLTSLDIKFDLVVSGCNDGWNISYDTIYSGTIGACLEAMVNKTPAVAISSEHDFAVVEEYLDEVINYINKYKLISNDYMLNINFPNSEVKGIEIGDLYYRKDQNYFLKDGENYYAHRYMDESVENKQSDCYQVTHGIISIVPLGKTCFDKQIATKLKELVRGDN